MSINVYSHVLGLLQKKLQISQIMSRIHDKRTFFHFQRNSYRFRIPVSFGIRFIKQVHAFQVYLPYFHHNREQFFHSQVKTDFKKSLNEKMVDLVTCIAQYHCMISVCCHTSQTKENQRFQ